MTWLAFVDCSIQHCEKKCLLVQLSTVLLLLAQPVYDGDFAFSTSEVFGTLSINISYYSTFPFYPTLDLLSSPSLRLFVKNQFSWSSAIKWYCVWLKVFLKLLEGPHYNFASYKVKYVLEGYKPKSSRAFLDKRGKKGGIYCLKIPWQLNSCVFIFFERGHCCVWFGGSIAVLVLYFDQLPLCEHLLTIHLTFEIDSSVLFEFCLI